MNNKFLTGFFLILTLVLLPSCASMQQGKSKLTGTLEGYKAAVRWGPWESALDYLAPEYLQDNPVTELELNRLRLFGVTAYQERQVITDPEGTVVTQIVEMRLYNKRTAIERTLIDRQLWKWDAEREVWRLHSGLPDPTQSR